MNPKPRDMGLLKTKYPFLDSPKAVVQKLFQEFFLYTSSEPQTAVYNIVMRFLKVRVMWVFYWVWVFFLIPFSCFRYILSAEIHIGYLYQLSPIFREYNNFPFLEELSPSHLHILSLAINSHSHPSSIHSHKHQDQEYPREHPNISNCFIQENWDLPWKNLRGHPRLGTELQLSVNYTSSVQL